MKYFGYFGSGYEGFGYDATPKVTGYSNLVWYEFAPAETLLPKLEKARFFNQAVIINIAPVLFKTPTFGIRSLAEEQLIEWYTALAPCRDAILGFLLADEPWRANKNLGALSVDPAVITANLELMAKFVAMSTGKITCVSASGQEFSTYKIPGAVDWLAMYRYSYNTHWTQLLLSAYSLVKRKYPTQKIIAVADAYEPVGKVPDQKRIKAFNGWWKTFIDWYPDEFQGVAPFLFQSGPMGSGADVMPMVEADLAAWALKLQR